MMEVKEKEAIPQASWLHPIQNSIFDHNKKYQDTIQTYRSGNYKTNELLSYRPVLNYLNNDV